MLWNFITFVKGDFVKKILVCLSLFFSFSNVMAQNKVGGGGVSGIRGGIRSGVDGGVSGGGRVFMGMEGGRHFQQGYGYGVFAYQQVSEMLQ